MASSRDIIVAGVDFGATKTCVSYCFHNGGKSSSPTIHSWSPAGCTEGITPSVVSYTPDGRCLYGAEVSDQAESLVWFKLLVEGPGERNTVHSADVERASLVEVVSSEASRLARGKEPVAIISDFLRRLYTDFLNFLAKGSFSFGGIVPPIQFWFTLPAIWSDGTRLRMLDAINGADFLSRELDTVYFITEAESAATYYVHTQSSSFKPNDAVLVCDAGGGTTDMAAFSIQSVYPSLVCQHLVSTAIRCGAADVDYDLYNLLCRGLGKSVNDLPEHFRGPTGRLMKVIRRDKGKLGPNSVTVPLKIVAPNANPAMYNRAKSRFTFHPQDVESAHKPAINAILSTLLQDIGRTSAFDPSTIKVLLTGGLSKSFHFQRGMETFLARRGLTIFTCPVTEAVAHGAVWRGLFGGLSQLPRSPSHFGLVSRELPPQFPAEQQPLHVPPVVCRPVWFLRKDEGFSVPHQGALTVKICHGRGDGEVVTITICKCDTAGDPPVLPDNLSRCRSICSLVLNFAETDLDHFWHQKVGYEIYYCLEVKVIWTIPSSNGTMIVQAFALGRQIGGIEISM